MSERRRFLRERKQLQHIVSAHEEAGDRARKHHLYDDAALHFQSALSIEAIAPDDRSRISEKLAYALSLGRDPNAASSLFDEAFASYLDRPEEPAKAIEILSQRAQQLWINARIAAALPLLREAAKLAKASGNSELVKMVNIKMATYVFALRHFKKAQTFLDTTSVNDTDGPSIQANYYVQKALVLAASGEKSEAIIHFERAVAAAKIDPNFDQIVRVWSNYAYGAMLMNDIELAKACHERSLFIARQFRIMWLIPFYSLNYAEVLYRMGQYGSAYEYLLEALSYDVRAPIVDIAIASIGIPLALMMNDDNALRKCTRTSTIDFAFRSNRPNFILPTATAFAQWYVEIGKKEEAAAVLHRAITAVGNFITEEQATLFDEDLWSFPVAAARFSAGADIARARAFFDPRVMHPRSEIMQAQAFLFEAYVAQRKQNHTQMLHCAAQAFERSAALGYYHQADLAQKLLPDAIRSSSEMAVVRKPFSDLSSVLTAREQQIVEFVLRGMTNRAIAEALSIKERTVEAHMTSIMSHLGVRSRYQLADQIQIEGRQM